METGTQDQRKMMILLIIVIVAIAVAAFSAFRTLGSNQGKVEGKLDMFPGGKQGEMQKQLEEPSGLSTGK
jgi:flagellar basal body-associated protein FliL